MPVAAATAAPPLEPPGVVSGFQGLRVMPVSGLSVTPFQPNSGVVVRPSSTAPCSRRRATAGESSSQDWSGETAFEPRNVGQPLARRMSLTDVGMPSTRPLASPRCQRCSEAFAAASEPSSSTRQKALKRPLSAAMRASAARVASTGDSFFAR